MAPVLLIRGACLRLSQSRTACDTALEALLARGIPTFAASGDDGARDNDPSHNMGKNADYPAASPYSFGELAAVYSYADCARGVCFATLCLCRHFLCSHNAAKCGICDCDLTMTLLINDARGLTRIATL